MKMELEMTTLLNKEVVVVKKDGFKKIGVLTALTDRFLILRFFDGKEEIISFEAIDSVKQADGRGGRV
jgi:predicted transcriptional regulator